MSKAVLTLLTHDTPLWSVDEETQSKAPGLPDGYPIPSKVNADLKAIQSLYDSLFEEDGDAYAFKGFDSESAARLLALSKEVEAELKADFGPVFEVENRIPELLLKGKRN